MVAVRQRKYRIQRLYNMILALENAYENYNEKLIEFHLKNLKEKIYEELHIELKAPQRRAMFKSINEKEKRNDKNEMSKM